MGLYNDRKDYEELVKENIEKGKLLYSINEEGQKLVLELLEEKEKIKTQNGFWANSKLNRINKKIQKIEKKYKK